MIMTIIVVVGWINTAFLSFTTLKLKSANESHMTLNKFQKVFWLTFLWRNFHSFKHFDELNRVNLRHKKILVQFLELLYETTCTLFLGKVRLVKIGVGEAWWYTILVGSFEQIQIRLVFRRDCAMQHRQNLI